MPSYDCPTCNKKFAVKEKGDAPNRPFCSERCKMIDLGRWLDGTYTITDDVSAPFHGDSAADGSQS